MVHCWGRPGPSTKSNFWVGSCVVAEWADGSFVPELSWVVLSFKFFFVCFQPFQERLSKLSNIFGKTLNHQLDRNGFGDNLRILQVQKPPNQFTQARQTFELHQSNPKRKLRKKNSIQ